MIALLLALSVLTQARAQGNVQCAGPSELFIALSHFLLFLTFFFSNTPRCPPSAVNVLLNGETQTWQLAAMSWASGITANGSAATLRYNDRAYIVAACANAPWTPSLFDKKLPMLNTVWNFTVDLSSASCGCNVGLYAVAMPARDSSGNPAPTKNGDFYWQVLPLSPRAVFL